MTHRSVTAPSDRVRMACWAPGSNTAPVIVDGLSPPYTRNLTNTDYVTATFGTPPTAFAGFPGPSRQFAVEFNVRR